jgi:hypothetical protein
MPEIVNPHVADARLFADLPPLLMDGRAVRASYLAGEDELILRALAYPEEQRDRSESATACT